jgi:hypothetical protein
MKKIIPCLLAVFSGAGIAGAAPIVVLDAPIEESETVTAKFDYDSQLGRAWIDIDEVDNQYEETPVATVQRKVDGLSYDSENNQVLYRKGDRSIVCAEEKSFLGIGSLSNTGNCPLRVSVEERTVDDGFRPEKQSFVKVTFDPSIQ